MSVPVISKECLVSEDLEEKSGTYRIEISNFLNKYRNAEKGQEVSTKKFFLSWSEFSLIETCGISASVEENTLNSSRRISHHFVKAHSKYL